MKKGLTTDKYLQGTTRDSVSEAQTPFLLPEASPN